MAKNVSLGKIAVAVVLAVAVLSMLSMVAYAVSGPISPQKKAVDAQQPAQPKAGEVTPEEAARYKCSSIQTMQDRIRCRLSLAEENEYDYLPEECRALINQSREKCVANYKKSQGCWASLKDTERFSCAKKAFGLDGTVASQKGACDALTGTNRSNCILNLTGKVDAIVKFRIYNLEEKAQRLMEKGANGELVANFVILLEQKKQEYNSANTTEQKKTVVREVQHSWQAFITKAKQLVKQ